MIMNVQIITRLNDVSSQQGILISGSITLSAQVGSHVFSTKEFMCLFTSDRRNNMMDSIQTLEVWFGERVVADCQGRFYGGEVPELDERSAFYLEFFLSILMMCIEAKDNLQIDMDETDLFPPSGSFLLGLWRRNFQS
ncbi:MAG: hypothetical protein A3G09_03165 [Candidatus Moranbacteria bacterium RIFCSPLOWO2_12_FULL_48_12]|nr:MAG: hypothetical protein A3G09_03165 [Candidatus Moranbacteria bacterium RIFCSPLOWO2_12_FULL_48_12]